MRPTIQKVQINQDAIRAIRYACYDKVGLFYDRYRLDLPGITKSQFMTALNRMEAEVATVATIERLAAQLGLTDQTGRLTPAIDAELMTGLVQRVAAMLDDPYDIRRIGAMKDYFERNRKHLTAKLVLDPPLPEGSIDSSLRSFVHPITEAL